jgi:hypothetical protein
LHGAKSEAKPLGCRLPKPEKIPWQPEEKLKMSLGAVEELCSLTFTLLA